MGGHITGALVRYPTVRAPLSDEYRESQVLESVRGRLCETRSQARERRPRHHPSNPMRFASLFFYISFKQMSYETCKDWCSSCLPWCPHDSRPRTTSISDLGCFTWPIVPSPTIWTYSHLSITIHCYFHCYPFPQISEHVWTPFRLSSPGDSAQIWHRGIGGHGFVVFGWGHHSHHAPCPQEAGMKKVVC